MADGSVHRATGRIWLTKLLDALKVLQLILLRLKGLRVTVISGWPGGATMSLLFLSQRCISHSCVSR